ncbi:hypothetical protein D516_4315 [Rhodobacter sp. AKP1]|nr:hypothetical protein D516_4315 [Rhodobacter sp. AKP1]
MSPIGGAAEDRTGEARPVADPQAAPSGQARVLAGAGAAGHPRADVMDTSPGHPARAALRSNAGRSPDWRVTGLARPSHGLRPQWL